MPMPRFSVRAMTFLVFLAAIDFVWMLKISRRETVWTLTTTCLDPAILGMANVLAVAGYSLMARRTGRAFLVGFVGGGLLWSVAYYAVFFRACVNPGWQIILRRWPVAEDWIFSGAAQPGMPGFTERFFLLIALLSLLGTVPLAAFSALFGLLARMVARREIPRMIAVALVAVLMGSVELMVRSVEHRRIATRYEEVCETLSIEAGARVKEIARLRSTVPPPSAQAEAEIKALEEQLPQYDRLLAENRRQLRKYRRVEYRPWLAVEE